MGGNRRVRRLVARGMLRRAPLRRGLLVAPRDTWPPLGGGLSLEPAGHARDGAPRFRYAHSAGYLVRSRALLSVPCNWSGVECSCRNSSSALAFPQSAVEASPALYIDTSASRGWN